MIGNKLTWESSFIDTLVDVTGCMCGVLTSESLLLLPSNVILCLVQHAPVLMGADKRMMDTK